MNEPEALRLAERLEQGYVAHETVLYPAAAELRRLHESNQELLSVLKEAFDVCIWPSATLSGVYEQARAAIAKAEGEQK